MPCCIPPPAVDTDQRVFSFPAHQRHPAPGYGQGEEQPPPADHHPVLGDVPAQIAAEVEKDGSGRHSRQNADDNQQQAKDTHCGTLRPGMPTPTDPGLDAREKPRLARQARAILALLQLGPVTTGEMATLTRSHSRRISDIRAAGHRVEIIARDHVTGNNTYSLVDRCEACAGKGDRLEVFEDGCHVKDTCDWCGGKGWVRRTGGV